MNLYFIAGWGHNGDGNAEDTCLLVRAKNRDAAVRCAKKRLAIYRSGGFYAETVDLCILVGKCALTDGKSKVIHGPWIAYAFLLCEGYETWHRHERLSKRWANDRKGDGEH